ncbi:MAG: hypothetical protein JO126_01805 [Alphaproteobacteria bacterium]|nr:hypothetical protein [Alphaproteobacteria bacterium]MBV8548172.1 hypothetical protein [Alphaproteobacteria bacterium]
MTEQKKTRALGLPMIYQLTDTGDEADQIKSAWQWALGIWRTVPEEDCYYPHTDGYYDGHQLDIQHHTSTLSIGARTAILVNNPTRTKRLIIAVNAAPNDNENGTQNNHRKNFYCALLKDGTVICGTTAGYEFSYIRDQIAEMYDLTATNELGSQFRNRDILPHYTVKFADPVSRAALLQEKNADGTPKLVRVNVDDVVLKPPEKSHVYAVDSSGNVKLYLSEADKTFIRRAAETGQRVRVEFATASLELVNPLTPGGQHDFHEAFDVAVRPSFFAAKDREIILTTHCSTKRSDGEEIEQIAQVRTNHATSKPDYPIPTVGAEVRLSLA